MFVFGVMWFKVYFYFIFVIVIFKDCYVIYLICMFCWFIKDEVFWLVLKNMIRLLYNNNFVVKCLLDIFDSIVKI